MRAAWQREDGQSMAEYALILAVLFVAAAVGFGLFGTGVATSITSSTSAMF
jgi:Flp pilus assembly pilin Flp